MVGEQSPFTLLTSKTLLKKCLRKKHTQETRLCPRPHGKSLNVSQAEFPSGKSKAQVESDFSQRSLTLCDLMDCSLPGSSVHGIFQARMLEWVAISCSRESSDSGVEPASVASPALAGRFVTTVPPGKPCCFLVFFNIVFG